MTHLICNAKPNIGGDVGDAEMRRFINIYYPQKYSCNEDKIKMGYKKANPYYKTSEFQNENKCNLFNYLLKFDYVNPYIPDCVSEATKNYLFDCDNTSSYLSDKFEFTDNENDYVTLREITDIFKEQYATGSRQYKTMTAKKMLEILKSNVIWSDKIAENFKLRSQKNGLNITNAIFKVKKIIEMDKVDGI
jgi:hypothetical protein